MKKWRLLSLRPAGWCVAHSNQEAGGQSVFLLLQHTVLGQPEVNLHKGGTLAGVGFPSRLRVGTSTWCLRPQEVVHHFLRGCSLTRACPHVSC